MWSSQGKCIRKLEYFKTELFKAAEREIEDLTLTSI